MIVNFIFPLSLMIFIRGKQIMILI